ncbi:autotransporter outer membrane beta-barrel domain-containing protein [Bartonella raoultii]|uniref:Autotransporter outer membrane beta-barrel domain-containing protein n=1 Tax=Bartonella raoultii TaxID=1457020 RepID=A0ABS7I3F6_9HYPH|nr:autotransporter outer membrane beta-barrel domain-containing protein [Bartonella raoultii]MBX4335204.1 autotransporter outer membrane beta-barrel domain-containing protein [Bartonella raoultii]
MYKIYKKNFLLCTIAGAFVFSHFSSAYAQTLPLEISKVDVTQGEKAFDNVVIRDRVSAVNANGKGATATIKKATITSEMVALSAAKGGRINAKDIHAKTLIKGLEITNGIINLEDSIVVVKGNHESYGINFGFITKFSAPDGKFTNQANFVNTKLLVEDGNGIIGPFSNGEITLKNSEIRADVLLQNKAMPGAEPVTLTLTADHSTLEGRANTLGKNKTVFNLNNDSKWLLKISKNETDNTDIMKLFNYDLLNIEQRARSHVSVLHLNASSIVFNEPTGNHYQTLSVGQRPQTAESNTSLMGLLSSPMGSHTSAPQFRTESSLQENKKPDSTPVYKALGDAKIYFNSQWSNGAAKEAQKTDKLLVYGDVSGTTKIHFINLEKQKEVEEEVENPLPSNRRGFSLVQVSGKASEDAFKLAKGYTTIGELPYKYILKAYGPTSSHGKANREQSFLGEGDGFWDFRLQNSTLDPEMKIKALVPQMASYLVMPNVVFSAGLADIKNQNTLLSTLQSTVFGVQEKNKKGLFLAPYGEKMTLSSNRTPLEYGYGANIRYGALQAGAIFPAMEDQNITTNFGFWGSYGKLDFTPKDIDGAGKTKLDKWSLSAYGNIQNNSGLYLNAFLSYGTLQGNITTELAGNTASLEHTQTWSASGTIGQKLATSVEGLIFEPQAQLIYQRILFGTLKDSDGFEVNMGNPHQWLVRVGGRLMQTTSTIEEGCAFSFYSKLNIIKAFENQKTIQAGDSFHLDTMGSSLEGGLGVNAQFMHNVALHADVNYQHKLQKSGISGMHFSAGLRYKF